MKGLRYRRHTAQVKKKRALDMVKHIWLQPDLEQWAIENYNNLKPCSCYMCGNPRRAFGLDGIDEIKSAIEYQEQIDELLLTNGNKIMTQQQVINHIETRVKDILETLMENAKDAKEQKVISNVSHEVLRTIRQS